MKNLLDGFHFRFRDDRVVFLGLDWGYGDSQPWLVDRTDRYLVMRVGGCRNWAGNYTKPVYTLAQWFLLEYAVDSKRVDLTVVKVIEECAPGSDWRKAKARLLRKMSKLS
jgi:hypothetical protein